MNISEQHLKPIDLPPQVIASMTRTQLKAFYEPRFDTQEELDEYIAKLLNKKTSQYHTIKEADFRYHDTDMEDSLNAKAKHQKRTWTDAEIEFLKANANYLSDNTIALALNIPNQQVQKKRQRLGLHKFKETYNVSWQTCPHIIWHDRDQFEEDLETLMEPAELPLFMNASVDSRYDLSRHTLQERPSEAKPTETDEQTPNAPTEPKEPPRQAPRIDPELIARKRGKLK